MKQLVKIFLLILITNYFGACSETGKEVHNSASESNIESTPTPMLAAGDFNHSESG